MGEVMSEKRPKLLFLVHPFPPFRSTACVRTWNIAKFLSRLGWQVSVVTPHPSLWRTVDAWDETDFALTQEGISRILTGHRWPWLLADQLKCSNNGLAWVFGGICRTISRLLGIPKEIGWIKEAEKACSILSHQDVDLILATGPPFLTFKLANRLSLQLGRPYVLDYRDPWSGNPHAPNLSDRAAIREEEKLVRESAAVTVVSSSWASNLEKRFDLGPKVFVISNGYDPEMLAKIKPFSFGHFAIVYAGNFYPPKRDIFPVMDALSRLKNAAIPKGVKWCFHYYGDHGAHVLSTAKRFKIGDRVKVHGNVSREEALSAVRGAGIAVTITTIEKVATPEDMGIVPAKMFEAIGLGIPVLLVSPNGSDADMIAQTTGLAGSFSGNDVNDMTSFFHNALSGSTPPQKSPELFAWTHTAKLLDEILSSSMNEIPSKKKSFQFLGGFQGIY